MLTASNKYAMAKELTQQQSTKASVLIDNPGVQLYSVRDHLGNNAGATFEKLAAIGYKHVEWFDVTTLAAQASLAKAEDLTITSAHVLSPYLTGQQRLNMNIPTSLSSPEKLIETLNSHGVKNLVLSYLFEDERQNLEQYKQLSDHLNRVGELCQPAGIQLCYHNHDFEFNRFDEHSPFELFLQELDSEKVKFELDVFWVKYAGLEPAKLITELGSRCHLLHLKDLKQMPSMKEPAEKGFFQPLGQGIIDFPAILSAAQSAGVNCGFVEQDHTSGNIFTELTTSLNYLKTLNSQSGQLL
ncbi:sugar phosphate isomerase/epimerase [Thalassotalea fonticola]|uniref:Sugar phosphate isomerase/epimerase n=1 Tax=Thalassotalea fonticola TaxID=3065649 RepID=A0ABZ0GKT7_9GAMM|nr:sugar phosphate isomerase/epimerase [Colwelliaceae bacterium S1-1]